MVINYPEEKKFNEILIWDGTEYSSLLLDITRKMYQVINFQILIITSDFKLRFE